MMGLLDCVRQVRPSKIYFAVDGPRADHPGEAEVVAQVRKLVSSIDWPCEIKTRFRDSNLGCARAIPDAITWMLSNEPYGIILEDDVRPVARFFSYASDLLERYRDDERVGLVSGFNHYNFQTSKRDSYHFTTRADIWSWGTWARVWKDYSLDITPYLPQLDDIIKRQSDIPRVQERLRAEIAYVQRKPDTWDYQFSLMIAAKGYLSAAPRKRLTANVGMEDPRGVHCNTLCYAAIGYRDIWEGDEVLIHPNDVAPDRKAIRLTQLRMIGKAAGGLDFLGDTFPPLRKPIYLLGNLIERVAPFLFRIYW